MKKSTRLKKISIFNEALDSYIGKNNIKINDINRAVLKIYYKRHVADGFSRDSTSMIGILKKLGLEEK